jgi:hypothetical protein
MESIPEYYVVSPGKLWAGNYPNAFSEEELQAKFNYFLQNDATFFLDLTEAGEMTPYAPILAAVADDLGLAVTHQRVPIPDFDVPTVEEMKSILDMIDAANAAGRMVYVHCHFGLGRTGTVVGCYLARNGLEGEEALLELERLREGTRYAGTSPITPEQRQMVLDWPVGG